VKSTLWRFSMQICHILIRGTILISVVASLKLWTLFPLVLWFLISLATANCVLKTDRIKEVFTACAGIFAPTAFISRHTLSRRTKRGPEIWKTYARCNAVLFFLFTSLGFAILATLVLFVHQTGLALFPPSLLPSSCDNIPYLFFKGGKGNQTECPENGYIEDYEAMINGTVVEQIFTEIKGALPEDLRHNFECQKWWFLYNSFLIVFALLDVIFVWIE